jgi:hypothetical protein
MVRHEFRLVPLAVDHRDVTRAWSDRRMRPRDI